MAPYAVLNGIFLIAAVLCAAKYRTLFTKSWLAAFLVLVALTAVFDNVIIAMRIVGYDTSRILGIYLAKAPIEDFAYAIVAMLIVPIIWHVSKGKR